MDLNRELRDFFAREPDVIFGCADVGWSDFARDYRAAVVIAVPYGVQLTADTWTEPDFEAGIQAAKARLEGLLAGLEALLRRCGTGYLIPSAVQTDEIGLRAPFPFKYAATRAGIGWIGRNDVVITRRYGPRVRLSAVLVDAPLETGRPVTESRCPEDCRLCVDACPCHALTGTAWNAALHREALIDYHRCNRMRSAFLPALGRKSACGRCLAACPFGTRGAPE